MLKTRFDNFPKGKNFSTILGDFLGKGIFNVDGDLWRFQRKMASLELRRNSIKSFAFDVMNNEIQNRLIPLLACVANSKDEIVLDLQDVFRRFSFDSICRFSFGLDPKCLELSLPISQFAISFDLASQLSAQRAMHVSPKVWKIKRFFNIGSERKLKKAINNEVVGLNQQLTSCEQLRELHYMQACVYESMRLYPPIQFDSKFCLDDDFLPDGTSVKKGTRVTYHPYAMGRMEELWGVDCLEFKPERWINKDGVFIDENPFKYPVFQAGVRVCLGKEMSIVELKSMTLSFFRRFHVELAHPSHHIPRFSPGLTASFRGGLPVFVREINST
ncbi:cytochrome P450 94C1-like [Solanum pennellii]|uniref:Cytochrome P450 94C1-like n=1 Tax=Solanum pennellii TaxID=28526 RepID=A0ABM1HKQ0_SOLPN|nr:cytochrome P450 94C1-like [Solanum pennellii]